MPSIKISVTSIPILISIIIIPFILASILYTQDIFQLYKSKNSATEPNLINLSQRTDYRWGDNYQPGSVVKELSDEQGRETSLEKQVTCLF